MRKRPSAVGERLLGRDPEEYVSFVVFTAVIVLAVSLRLRTVSELALLDAEGVHLYLLSDFVATGSYTYDPWSHGPLFYYLARIWFEFTGVSLEAGRTLIALSSVGMLAATYWLRPYIGSTTFWVSAGLIAVHPYLIAPAQIFRHDALLAVILLAAIPCYERLRRRRDRSYAAGLGCLLAAGYASHETAVIFVPLLGLPIVACIVREYRRDHDLLEAVDAYFPLAHVASFVGAGLVTVYVFYSGWPVTVAGVIDAPRSAAYGIKYWLLASQHHSAPDPTFYLPWLASAPVLTVAAVVGIAGTLRQHRSASLVRWIALSWAVGVFIAISAIITHQHTYYLVYVAPGFVLLAAYGVSDVVTWIREHHLDAIPASHWFTDPGSLAMGCLLVTASIIGPVGAMAITSPPDPADREYRFEYRGVFDTAKSVADETECDIFIARTHYANYTTWALRWYFYESSVTIRDGMDDPPPDAIIVTADPVERLDRRQGKRIDTDSGHVYVPSPC